MHLLPVISFELEALPPIRALNWEIQIFFVCTINNALDDFSKTTFAKDIVDSDHSPGYISKSCCDPEEIVFTIHLPFQQLKAWYAAKQNSDLSQFTYVQILNAFIGKNYPTKVNEDCSRINERLRVICTNVARTLIRKRGRCRQDLLSQIKSIAVKRSELTTVASVGRLESEISRLEESNKQLVCKNIALDTIYKETSLLASKLQTKVDESSINIEKLKEENENLYNVIEKICPQRKFEDKGRPLSEVGSRQQQRKIKVLKTRIEQALWFSESFGLHLDTCNFLDDNGKAHLISFGNGFQKSYKELPEEQQHKIQQILFIMDKFCIGDSALHELTCCLGKEHIPRSYLVKQCREA